jgi:hypothetical protein
MRKTINDNARNLALWFSLLLYGWFVLAIVLLEAAARSMTKALAVAKGKNLPPDQFSVFDLPTALAWDWQLPLLGLIISAIGTAAIFSIAQANGYRQQQQHNARELRFFLTKYLGRIADRYREATGNAKQVTVGKEIDSAKLAAMAQLWHKIMVWMPFRTFYIECFVRSIIYQIRRNTSYYMLIPWGAIALLVAFAWFANSAFQENFGDAFKHPHFLPLYVGTTVALALLTLFYYNRIGAVVLGEELSRLDWLGYSHLDVSSAMDAVVGKYAEDVGYWKSRMRP